MEPSFIGLFENIFGTLSAGLSNWGGVHPVVVHFPIVLMFIAPFFALAALYWQKSARTCRWIALIFMLIGVASIFAATSSGNQAAEHLTDIPLEVLDTLEPHVRLAEQSRLGFCILAAIYLLYVLLKEKWPSRLRTRTEQILVGLFLLVYAFQLLLLFNAAHYGGKLVHKHGLRSSLYAPTTPQEPTSVSDQK